MPPIRPPPPPRPENPPVHPPMKRALEASVESLVEVEDGSQPSAQKYFELDPSKVYLKITDIVKDFAKIYGARWFFRHADYMSVVKNESLPKIALNFGISSRQNILILNSKVYDFH